MADLGSASDPLSLAGRRALVTGAAGAIGGAARAVLEAHGARVHPTDLEGEGMDPCDVADPRAVEDLVARAAGSLGGLDILVHAAGITRDRVLWKLSDEEWRRVLAVNLDSAFHLLRAAAPHLRASGNGAVVLVSSINGERGKFGQANYAASKAGLIGLGRTAARELGTFGVRVNVVAPGLIETPMTAGLSEELKARALEETALGRIGRPEDVARGIFFLCSDLARHVTGQVLRIDGGQLMA